mgnify:CR=1 FL=1
MDGKQGGDPAKLADALVQLAALEEPPARFAAGADAVQTFEARQRRCSHRPTPTALCPPRSLFDNTVTTHHEQAQRQRP